MQPTYLPWAGYFNLIGQVDNFIFLDDVQFERRSWQSRNRILLQGKEYVLTVPVNKVDRGTLISKITTSGEIDWQKDHWQTLKSAYGKAAHGSEALDILEPFYCGAPPSLLSEFNQAIIQRITEALGIGTRLVRATDLQCEGRRSMHLIKICEALGCDEYVSPRGSMEYLEQDNFSDCTATRLAFHEYTPAPYPQNHAAGFVSHLSIVDVIANAGLEFTKAYIA
ncbi:MAG: WbqC family protein [Thiobacillus sp.]|nr:WbqC family protein [Thiobacillus sp.]